MKPIVLVLTLLLASPLVAQQDASEPTESSELMALVDQFYNSIRAGDREGYADVFVDDFVFTWSGDGGVWAPESIFPNVAPTPDLVVLIDEVVTRSYGDAALINFRQRSSEEEPGVRVTFSLVRLSGEWKAMSYQSTAIPEGN